MCTIVVADSGDDVSSMQVNRVRFMIVLTELIIREDISGNSPSTELLWRSILVEFMSIGDTREVTLCDETVLV